MEHDGGFDTWWKSRAICSITNPCSQGDYYAEYNITQSDFKIFRFPDGFNTGDIMVLYGTKMENVKVGDVIVFRSSRPDPIIHRVIEKKIKNSEIYFRTKGDHNTASIDGSGLNEEEIGKERFIGRAVVRVPYLGWIKLGFVKLIELFRTIIVR
ncbi:signal peptidase I [Candidatus Woesearchaeota archaeon]|nr:signal peptidase I [Candidatus Woesearchaeota archaeon]